MINPFDINLIDLKIEKYSLKIIDHKLNVKYFNYRIQLLLPFYRNVHWFLILIFGLYSLISGLLNLSQNYISNIVIFLFFIFCGLFFFTETYKRFYSHSVYFSSLCVLGSLLYYQWTNLEIVFIYTTSLSALVFTINFNLDLFYLMGINIFYHLLMYIRLKFKKI